MRLLLPLLSWYALAAPSSAQQTPPAEHEPAEIQRVVAAKDVCAWPNLTLMKDGSIVAVLHNKPSHGGMEGDVECWASADGTQWEKRSVITQHDPDTIRMNHAAGLAKNGDLIALCSGWTNIKQPERPKQPAFRDATLSNWVMRSADMGRTWTRGEGFAPAEKGWCDQIPFGDIWVGEDGALRTSCYRGKLLSPEKSFKIGAYESWHFRSDDDGRTWKAVSIIGPKHNETDIFPLGGKRWMAAARVDAMELFTSEDDGVTWSSPQRVTQRNEINGHLTRLKDGRLLLTYGVRIKEEQGVRAKFSSDDGKTWSDPIRLMRSDDGDCGYPSSVQRADGRIVTAYYSRKAAEHDGYHMGVAIWAAPAGGK
jgi:hypothetical protein